MSTLPTDLPASIAATHVSQPAVGKQLQSQREPSLRVQLRNQRDVLTSSDQVDLAHQPSATGDGQAEGRLWWSNLPGRSSADSGRYQEDPGSEPTPEDRTGLRIDLHG